MSWLTSQDSGAITNGLAGGEVVTLHCLLSAGVQNNLSEGILEILFL